MPDEVPEAERLDTTLHVRLSESFNERLRREADKRAVNIGALTRHLLARQVESWESESVERTIVAV